MSVASVRVCDRRWPDCRKQVDLGDLVFNRLRKMKNLFQDTADHDIILPKHDLNSPIQI